MQIKFLCLRNELDRKYADAIDTSVGTQEDVNYMAACRWIRVGTGVPR